MWTAFSSRKRAQEPGQKEKKGKDEKVNFQLFASFFLSFFLRMTEKKGNGRMHKDANCAVAKTFWAQRREETCISVFNIF
mgnify:CR=1 FL=1